MHSLHREAELPTPEAELHEIKDTMEKEKERLQAIRSQLAKKNRAVVSIERQLDSIPDRPELTQYQHRFLELYNQGKFFNNNFDANISPLYFSCVVLLVLF